MDRVYLVMEHIGTVSNIDKAFRDVNDAIKYGKECEELADAAKMPIKYTILPITVEPKQ